jgi:hypothetical protein
MGLHGMPDKNTLDLFYAGFSVDFHLSQSNRGNVGFGKPFAISRADLTNIADVVLQFYTYLSESAVKDGLEA